MRREEQEGHVWRTREKENEGCERASEWRMNGEETQRNREREREKVKRVQGTGGRWMEGYS